MFENLKAFIRHGKQANEFKKRANFDDDEALQDDNLANYHNINHRDLQNMYLDGEGYTNETEYAQHRENIEQVQKHNAEIIAEQQAEYNAELEAARAKAEAKAEARAQAEAEARAGESEQQQQNYQQAASQIVEQENLQKQKPVQYPGLDNYEILEQMGEGAFSIVYKARHLPSQNLVAIKILRKFQMDQAQKQAVLKEATIMRQLNHPNIVKFIEFIDSDTYYYIIQEIAIGGEIFTAIVNYTYLSEDLSRHVITQVAHAIRYLHEEVGIVHRDIKPENLLYMPIEFKPSINPIAKLRKSDDPNSKKDEGDFIPNVGGGTIGQVKLADFGLSKQIWEHNTKTPCGTVGYTAPEIVRDEKYSKEVDMWALGCVLYTLLCGFPPFYDERIEALTEKVARGEYTFLQPWWDEISVEAKHCVSKLLTVDPSKRYTIDDLLNDPWLCKNDTKRARSASQSAVDGYPQKNKQAHPIQNVNRYSKKFMKNSDLYSPAAVALRDAFDISAAVHRMGEEAALANKVGGIGELLEEEEDEYEEEVNNAGQVVFKTGATPRQHHKLVAAPPPANVFDLNLGGASILERRKNKPVPLQG